MQFDPCEILSEEGIAAVQREFARALEDQLRWYLKSQPDPAKTQTPLDPNSWCTPATAERLDVVCRRAHQQVVGSWRVEGTMSYTPETVAAATWAAENQALVSHFEWVVAKVVLTDKHGQEVAAAAGCSAGTFTSTMHNLRLKHGNWLEGNAPRRVDHSPRADFAGPGLAKQYRYSRHPLTPLNQVPPLLDD